MAFAAAILFFVAKWKVWLCIFKLTQLLKLIIIDSNPLQPLFPSDRVRSIILVKLVRTSNHDWRIFSFQGYYLLSYGVLATFQRNFPCE